MVDHVSLLQQARVCRVQKTGALPVTQVRGDEGMSHRDDHAGYARGVMSAVAQRLRADLRGEIWIPYLPRSDGARLDGVLTWREERIAAQYEARNWTQIRGPLLDLIWCDYRRKLLLLMSPNLSDDLRIKTAQCEHVLSRFLPPDAYRVVPLMGSGRHGCGAHQTEDASRLAAVLQDWLRGGPPEEVGSGEDSA